MNSDKSLLKTIILSRNGMSASISKGYLIIYFSIINKVG